MWYDEAPSRSSTYTYPMNSDVHVMSKHFILINKTLPSLCSSPIQTKIPDPPLHAITSLAIWAKQIGTRVSACPKNFENVHEKLARRKIVLNQVNASAHSAKLMNEFSKVPNVELMTHPLYRPKIKDEPKGIRLTSPE
ncbi:hypothetical protein EVAR_17711_1 [Eumeta japonica]|uniref:Mariner Mos1 transposase n=1 Tax=Eumeta variegata TaxID=151549 RepID=A0A4C1URS0_EUMVA|nr:hypothetical protein EVAR_17711_1 [Eumeta japonica]